MGIANKFNAGQVALTGSAQQLPSESGASGGFILKAPAANVAPLAIGEANTVTLANGFLLEPGERVPIEILSLNKIWVIGTAADDLCYICIGSGS